MVGILLITHNSLGESLIECVRHITGKTHPGVSCIGVEPGDDFQYSSSRAIQAIAQLDQGDGVLVLTDIYGATPTNITKSLLMPGRVEGIAGVNLPMLVRALTHRNEPLASVAARALSGAVECVVHMKAES
ncbi:MAG TPA: PTS fructose transporter subunit IIA [Burkholderiales bacterium]|jgi:mannose PTS system EIIA component|nr:PTS fructose transporter subunit IIA [Burkholderiales bacterium]